MNKMMHKKNNVNTVLYKSLITTNFNSKSMRFFLKNVKNKEGWIDPPSLNCDPFLSSLIKDMPK